MSVEQSQVDVPLYFTQLCMRWFRFCVLQVVKGLLKFWPKTCSQKEVSSVIFCNHIVLF